MGPHSAVLSLGLPQLSAALFRKLSLFLNLGCHSLSSDAILLAPFLIPFNSYQIHNSSDSPELNKSLNHNYTLLEEPHKNNSWTCLANGNPGLIVTWHVNGGAVGEGYVVHEKAKDLGNRHQTESTITMVGITRNKSSSLSCNVSNDLGNSSSLAYIIINCKYLTNML